MNRPQSADFHFPSQAVFPATQTALLGELGSITDDVLGFAGSLTTLCGQESFRQCSMVELNARRHAKAWSALECLEHLNRYAAHYLPQLEAASSSASIRNKEAYQPGFMGKRFALAMHPGRRAKAISAPKNMNPLGSKLEASVLTQFVADQQRWRKLIAQLSDRSLLGSPIPLSIFPLLKFQLGDMLACLVWHNARHSLQANEAIASSASLK